MSRAGSDAKTFIFSFFLFPLALVCHPSPASAGVRAVWAVNDGEKIAKTETRTFRNSAWNGRTIRVFGARNELLAVQLIVQADGAGIRDLRVSLPDVRLQGSRDDAARIVYAAPGADPTDYADRPIQIFSVGYLQVTAPTNADWIYPPGGAAAPRDPTGWKPVQLIPENAVRGRGGFPLSVAPAENQAIWIEIYTGRGRRAGVYRGEVSVTADGTVTRVPIELELFGFTLPDRNTMDAMVYFQPGQPELYHGRRLDAQYHRFAHRQRIELVHAYSEREVMDAMGRFTGDAFTRANRYEGPGERVGNRIVPASFYGPGTEYDDRERAWKASDAWMRFLERVLPGALSFLYLPDEPRPSQYERIRRIGANIHSNPGPGRRLRTFVTHRYAPELDEAIDIWNTGPQHFDVERARVERARGREYWTYNGGRPAAGAIVIDAPATDPRATIWACFKHGVQVYFYWHGVHWRHNRQKQGDPVQNVWANPVTFDNRGEPGKEGGYANGDGVLMYPGEDRLHPDQSRAIAGPCSTIQLANFRRGLQDHQYLTLAVQLGLEADVKAAIDRLVPRVFSEAGRTVAFSERGDDYEDVRYRLARAIASRVTK